MWIIFHSVIYHQHGEVRLVLGIQYLGDLHTDVYVYSFCYHVHSFQGDILFLAHMIVISV